MDLPDPIQLAFDDVVIDFTGHRLMRAGVERPLERKAFAVMVLLAAAPGRVFTRDEILDQVWGHRHVTPGVLNRVMTLLRHALGEDAHDPRYLHTLHGIGYRFDRPATHEGSRRGPGGAWPPGSVSSEEIAGGTSCPAAPTGGVVERRAGDRRMPPAR